MTSGIQFYCKYQKTPSGLRFVGKVGVGTDQSLWLDAAEHGVTPQMIAAVKEQYSMAIAFFNDEDWRVYVRACVITDNCDPAIGKAMNASIDALLDVLHPTNFRK